MSIPSKNKTHARSVHANNGEMLGVFRRLAESGSSVTLMPKGRCSPDCDRTHTIGREQTASHPAHIPVDEKNLRDWLARDLIEAAGSGYRLSSAGWAWLRRELASADAFQEQHQVRAVREIEHGKVKRPAVVDETESPLAWLASRKDKNGVPLLTAYQFEAGERLRADYYFAGLTAKVTASWDAAAVVKRGGGGNDRAALTDNVLAARQRVMRALGAVGPEMSGILVDVCCHLKGLEEAEKTEGWPQRSGKVVLQIALTRLARYYGLVSDGQLAANLKRRLQHWGADDYRPSISPETGTGE